MYVKYNDISVVYAANLIGVTINSKALTIWLGNFLGLFVIFYSNKSIIILIPASFHSMEFPPVSTVYEKQ